MKSCCLNTVYYYTVTKHFQMVLKVVAEQEVHFKEAKLKYLVCSGQTFFPRLIQELQSILCNYKANKNKTIGTHIINL